MDGLQNNNSEKDNNGFGKSIKAIALHLSRSKRTSKEIETAIFNREQEERILIDFLGNNAFCTENIDKNNYIAEGTEQKVYFSESKNTVFKVNSGVFYVCWEDYFYSLLLHNFFFADTAYYFVGLKKENEKLFVVVEQVFVKITEPTNLEKVKNICKL